MSDTAQSSQSETDDVLDKILVAFSRNYFTIYAGQTDILTFDEAKAALKQWAYAESLPILNDMRTKSQPFDTESTEKIRTVWNDRINTAAANLKRRFGMEGA